MKMLFMLCNSCWSLAEHNRIWIVDNRKCTCIFLDEQRETKAVLLPTPAPKVKIPRRPERPENTFIDPALAEDRDVFCGYCNKPVKGHAQGCPHCNRPFHANTQGYARICSNTGCRRTETAGHVHGLCVAHADNRRKNRARTALQADCKCGNKTTKGHDDCSRCRSLKTELEPKQ
jgi:hypothetical protein